MNVKYYLFLLFIYVNENNEISVILLFYLPIERNIIKWILVSDDELLLFTYLGYPVGIIDI